VVIKDANVNPDFLYYLFLSPQFNRELVLSASGTKILHTAPSRIEAFEFKIPPVFEQEKIGRILRALDDKIELNRKMNETLEAMARALFKSWFVDFDPVRAKAEGRPTGLPDHISALFPDSFEDSELGEIPKGWKCSPFAGTVNIIGGGTPKTTVAEYWNGDIPWFSVVDAPSTSDVWAVDTEKKITQAGVENSSTKVLPERTTIISARGTVGRVALVGVPMAMNQSCYGLNGKHGRCGSFTYFLTRQVVSQLQQGAHGSVFDTITRQSFELTSVVVAPEALISAFEDLVEPYLLRILNELIQSHSLASLRNMILPKLISGEIRVSRTKQGAMKEV
jgi:type I restriction enzyme S subunit